MMMKKIIFNIPAVLLALLALSCTKAPDKHEVEAGFTPAVDLPQVTISKSNIEIDEYSGEVTVDVVVSGIKSLKKKLEIGLMSSTDFDFYQSKAVPVPASNNTHRITVPVSAGKTNWLIAMCSVTGAADYSAKIAIDVPDVPWYYKVASAYVGDFESTAGSYPNHQIYLSFSQDYKNAVLYNFDPYVASVTENYDPLGKKSNYLVGTLDLERRVIVFTPSSGQFYSLNDSSYMMAAIKSFENNNIQLASSFEISISEDGQSLELPWLGVFNSVRGAFEMVYSGPVTIKAN